MLAFYHEVIHMEGISTCKGLDTQPSWLLQCLPLGLACSD